MMENAAIPMPPAELRVLVGPPEEEFFDNPTGKTLYSDLPADAYDSVFDFGCGCGSTARMLLQQNEPKVRRYVGIDVHGQMLDWCANNITPVAPHFQFHHHDVWSPSYGRANSFKLAAPFPVEHSSVSLFIANSVFTHIYKEQAEYYLFELSRILKSGGVAMTSWFFFDNESFPFQRGGVPCLFTDEIDPTHAVIYDRKWFVDTLAQCGLAVRKTKHPPVAGHQWWVQLEKRTAASVDAFPLGEDQAEWLCGATVKPIAKPSISHKVIETLKVGPSIDLTHNKGVPVLRGLPAELAAAQAALAVLAGTKTDLTNTLTNTKSNLAALQAELARIQGTLIWRVARKLRLTK